MLKTFYIQTHGCQMNEYDSTKMADLLKAFHGMKPANTPEEADLLLLNTCSIREKPQEKVFHQLGRWQQLKKQKPEIMIGVGGCVASQEGADIVKRAPFVDLVFGPQTLHRLPQLINQRIESKKPTIDITFPEIEKFDCLVKPQATGASAFVSIMEGCSKYCSFCVVPYTRGEEISRPFDEVLSEVVQLSEQGVREIHLLGQNVNDYQGAMHQGNTANLALLIHYIAAINTIARIRFTTSHPSAFSDHLIQAFAEEPKLANHLHLPVQSGSDRILAAMKRNYTALEYKAKIRKLRQVRPNISLSSDFIVGFPNESEYDFQQTMKLIKEVNFDTSFSFIYSKRPGTPAASLPDAINQDTKKQRLALLQNQLQQQANKISQSLVGTHQVVLVSGKAKKGDGLLAARTECNRVVHFPATDNLIGTLPVVKITQAKPHSLTAELIALEEQRSI